jgi:hypothetical protein
MPGLAGTRMENQREAATQLRSPAKTAARELYHNVFCHAQALDPAQHRRAHFYLLARESTASDLAMFMLPSCDVAEAPLDNRIKAYRSV